MKATNKKVSTEYTKNFSFTDNLFSIIMPLVMALIIGGGLFLQNIKPVIAPIVRSVTAIKTQFVMQNTLTEEPRPLRKIAPPKPPEEKVKPQETKQDLKQVEQKREEVVDLTQNPVMNQKADETPDNPTSTGKPVRRVYGLRKVFSTGLGSGGSMGEAIVGKLGNTLNKEIDTIKASKEEVKGRIVPTTTVTQAPKFSKKVKPEYSAEMIENKVEGVVQVKVLVDIDGKVKEAIVMNDLGFGSKEKAASACFDMEFEPARRGSDPVAVWIIIPIRFVLLS